MEPLLLKGKSRIPVPEDRVLFNFEGGLKDVDGFPVTTTGSVNAQGTPQFGTGSLNIVTPSSELRSQAPFDASGDFTIELAIGKHTANTNGNNYLISLYPKSPIPGQIGLQIYGNALYFYAMDKTTPSWSKIFPELGVRDNSWHHIALSVKGDNWMIGLNGVRQASLNLPGGHLAKESLSFISLGNLPGNSVGAVDFYIDEVMLSAGVARYVDATYPVPTVPHV